MNPSIKETNEAPMAEVMVVSMEKILLGSVDGVRGERAGGGYGSAIEEDWD